MPVEPFDLLFWHSCTIVVKIYEMIPKNPKLTPTLTRINRVSNNLKKLKNTVSGPFSAFLLRKCAHGTSAWHLSATDEFDVKDLIKVDEKWLVGKKRSRAA
jgi:hypothetical protein